MTAIKNFLSSYKPHIVRFNSGTYAIRFRMLFAYNYLDTNIDAFWRHDKRHFAEFKRFTDAQARLLKFEQRYKDYGTKI